MASDWHYQIGWMTLRGQRSTSLDSKYLENDDRYEVGPTGFRLAPSDLTLTDFEGSKIKAILSEVKYVKNGKSYDVGPNGDYIECPWASLWMTYRGHNPLIRNILKTVTDTRLDPREDFFESSRRLSIGTVKFDLGWP